MRGRGGGKRPESLHSDSIRIQGCGTEMILFRIRIQLKFFRILDPDLGLDPDPLPDPTVFTGPVSAILSWNHYNIYYSNYFLNISKLLYIGYKELK